MSYQHNIRQIMFRIIFLQHDYLIWFCRWLLQPQCFKLSQFLNHLNAIKTLKINLYFLILMFYYTFVENLLLFLTITNLSVYMKVVRKAKWVFNKILTVSNLSKIFNRLTAIKTLKIDLSPLLLTLLKIYYLS